MSSATLIWEDITGFHNTPPLTTLMVQCNQNLMLMMERHTALEMEPPHTTLERDGSKYITPALLRPHPIQNHDFCRYSHSSQDYIGLQIYINDAEWMFLHCIKGLSGKVKGLSEKTKGLRVKVPLRQRAASKKAKCSHSHKKLLSWLIWILCSHCDISHHWHRTIVIFITAVKIADGPLHNRQRVQTWWVGGWTNAL